MEAPKSISISPLAREQGLTRLLRDDLAYTKGIAERYKALSVKLKEHLDEARRLSLEKSKKLKAAEKGKVFFFDCWGRPAFYSDSTVSLQTIEIRALNRINAEIVFKATYPELAYDEPYT